MSAITTHILDVSRGRPAAGVGVVLERLSGGGNDAGFRSWTAVGRGVIDSDGRLRDLLGGELQIGTYRLRFDTRAYFREQNISSFYPEVVVVFDVGDVAQHYHVPLLLSPFGYSTYRGS